MVAAMKQRRSTGTPTIAQKTRFVILQDIGCITCLSRGERRACEIHHLTVGGKHGQKRRGHDFTIGLCEWCHRGVGLDSGQPSYAREPRRFREVFGDDDALLAEQNRLIAIWRDSIIGGR
jgi:hypothetical protein